MLITVLTENEAISDRLKKEHGLSLHIQTEKGTLLFDMGQTDGFIGNAEQMGIDLHHVDAAIISHGHYDHGGGLTAFMDYNKQAPIYIKKSAFRMQFSKGEKGLRYIGLEQRIKGNPRLIYTRNSHKIEDDAHLFSGVNGDAHIPRGTGNELLCESEGCLVDDPFDHEQHLILSQGGKDILFVGCAHCGIVNIIEHFVAKRGKFPDVIVGGLHLNSLSLDDPESVQALKKIGSYLRESPMQIYACHCTGKDVYRALKEYMNVKIGYLAAGNALEI